MTPFRRFSLARILRNLFALIGLLLILVTLAPALLDAWANQLSGRYQDPRGDILIVLGADELDIHAIGVASYWRSVYAVLAWRAGGFREVLISGGPKSSPVSVLMKDFMVSQGVPPEAIVTETESASTRENALNAARLLAGSPGRKVLLTSDYHMRRAAGAFRKVGLEVTPSYFPDAVKRATDWRNRWRVFLDLTQESVKIVWYRLHGWM